MSAGGGSNETEEFSIFAMNAFFLSEMSQLYRDIIEPKNEDTVCFGIVNTNIDFVVLIFHGNGFFRFSNGIDVHDSAQFLPEHNLHMNPFDKCRSLCICSSKFHMPPTVSSSVCKRLEFSTMVDSVGKHWPLWVGLGQQVWMGGSLLEPWIVVRSRMGCVFSCRVLAGGLILSTRWPRGCGTSRFPRTEFNIACGADH